MKHYLFSLLIALLALSRPVIATADGAIYTTISGIQYQIGYVGERETAVGTGAIVVKCLTNGEVPNIESTVTGTLTWKVDSVTYSRQITGTVTSIGPYAFSGSRITDVHIPETIGGIYYDAFNNCDCLTSITIPANISTIGSHAFAYCDNLKTVYLNSRNLQEPVQRHTYDPEYDGIWTGSPVELVVIGESVESIGDWVFYLGYMWTSIKKIISKAIIPPANDGDLPMVPLTVPVQSLQAYKNHPIWKYHFITATGDVDNDGRVNIDDVTSLIDQLLNNEASGNAGADVDSDGNVSIADVTALIDLLLKGN